MEPEDLQAIIQAVLREVRTAMPARVESFDHETQTCSVTPCFKNAYPDGEGGTNHLKHPVIPNVKVKYPRGNGCFMYFPLVKGDYVLLQFCERSLQAWRSKGGVVEPGDLGMFPLDGAVALAGWAPDDDPIEDAHATLMRLGIDGDASAQVEFAAGQVRAGQGADKAVALAEKVRADLNTLKSAISGATIVAQDGGASLKSTIVSALSSWPSSEAELGASNLKARE